MDATSFLFGIAAGGLGAFSLLAFRRRSPVRGGSAPGGPTRWHEVDRYLADLFAPHDDPLEEAVRSSEDAGLPSIQVSANLGAFLSVLVHAVGARRILEVGTLGGYSSIWMARALPDDGRLVTLELSEKHAEVARANLERAGVGDRVEIRVGPALESLESLVEEDVEPFDLVFLDADKENNRRYFEWALQLTRTGSLIVTDNVVRNGRVIESGSGDAQIEGVREQNAFIAAHPGVRAAALQTVGSKGYDGFSVAVVTAPSPKEGGAP